MMDDTDLAGPLLFCFVFGMMLLLAGKAQFGYIYGVALMGDFSIYLLLNMMSESGIDAYRVASVLGYCILPLCLLAAVAVFITLEYVAVYFVRARLIVFLVAGSDTWRHRLSFYGAVRAPRASLSVSWGSASSASSLRTHWDSCIAALLF